MALRYLIDTDVFSLMVKGQDPAVLAHMQTLERGAATLSVISAGEYFYGVAHAPVSKLRQQRAERLMDFLGVMALDASVANVYGTIRAALRAQGTPIGPNDLWLAAQAQAQRLTLVTRNVGEFRRVKGLKVNTWD